MTTPTPGTGLAAFRDAVSRVAGDADAWEAAGVVPRTVVDEFAATGVLGALVPEADGGSPWSYADVGEACRLLATVSPSAQSLVTVHGMVTQALARWGSHGQRDLLPELAAGRLIASFALTDDGAGSDISSPSTCAERHGAGWRVTGIKRWLCFGRLAGLFLVFCASADGDVCLLVSRDDPGVTIVDELATSGFAGAGLARLELDGVLLPADRMLARPRFALTQVAVRALTLGRFCVAAGAVGLAGSALDSMLGRAGGRRQFGGPLADLQLVRGLVADVAVAVAGAAALTQRAAQALDSRDAWAGLVVLEAKLSASRAATLAATSAAQVHGAVGLLVGGRADRRVQDARVLEVIEGNSQLLQDLVAQQTMARRYQELHRTAVTGDVG